MDALHHLFEQFAAGNLEDSRREELHELLTEAYFSKPGELNQDEKAYIEDLLFSSWLDPSSDTQIHQRLENLFREDKELERKAQRFARLHNGLQPPGYRFSKEKIVGEVSEEKEEAGFRKVLHEIYRKIEEEEKEIEQGFPDKIANTLTVWIHQLFYPQPRLRLSVVFASLALLFTTTYLLWNYFSPSTHPPVQLITGLTDTLSNTMNLKSARDTTQTNNPVEEIEKVNVDRLSDIQINRSIALMASIEPPVQRFEYYLTRSAPDPSRDSLVAAAKLFNERNYKASIYILNSLLRKNAFQDPDTISKIQLYLGISYFNLKGMNLALRSLSKISTDTEEYKDALFYMLFANLALGRKAETEKLLVKIASQTDAQYLQDLASSVKIILK